MEVPASVRGLLAPLILGLVVVLWGCGGDTEPSPAIDSVDEIHSNDVETVATQELPETDTGPEVVKPYTCEGTPDPTEDPMVMLGRQEPLCPLPTHFLDIAHDPETGRIYSVGLPGLVIHQDTGGEPQHLSFFPEIPPDLEAPSALREYEHLALLPGGLLAATARLPAQRQYEAGESEPIAPDTMCPDGCPPDWECLEEVGCSHGCSTSSDCQHPGNHCIYGWCTSSVDGPCEEMGHCAPGHACASGSCVPVGLDCITSDQCGGDSQCVDDVCTTDAIPCEASGTCPNDRHCIQGLCSWTPVGCEEVTDCAAYHRCHDGVCVPEARECDQDLQCQSGSVCIKDACIEKSLYCPGGCEAGLVIIDPEDGEAAQLVAYLEVESAAGMAVHGEVLYLLTYTGNLLTVDISTPASPAVLHEVDGLGSPRKLTIVGERAYIADHSRGLVVVDITEPLSPSLGAVIPTAGGPLDIDEDDGHLFVACGTSGLQVFSLVDGDAPSAVGLASTGSPLISVSVSDHLAWTTDQDGVQVFDVSDTANPVVLATEQTPSWAMAVDAHGDQAWISDWNAVLLFSFDDTITAPDIHSSRSEIYLTNGVAAAELTIGNHGAAPLELTTQSSDPRLKLSLDLAEVSPGEQVGVTVTFEDDGEPLQGEICLTSNDPDEPTMVVEVASSSEGSTVLVGEEAPDFVLPDLSGELHQLSAEIGHPVVLCYFATW